MLYTVIRVLPAGIIPRKRFEPAGAGDVRVRQDPREKGAQLSGRGRV